MQTKAHDGRHTLAVWPVVLIPLLFMALATVHSARADPNVTLNLARTGQTTCTDESGAVIGCAGTGQDGDTLAGAVWPAPRFVDNQDQTITDALTGLTWTKNAETPGYNLFTCSATNITINWQQALDHVACLNSRNYLGHNDWRLPNIVELESLVNNEQPGSDDWLEAQGFVNVWGSYWSSTTVVAPQIAPGEVAHGVNFLTNETRVTGKTDTTYLPAVWPVRGATSGVTPLWKSGQTQSYAAYDDGYYETGRAWPNPRFTTQGDCVTDAMTGLVWPRDADLPNGLRTWQEALTYANNLTLCGFSDWRLPNRRELWSLTTFSAVSPGDWLLAQGFNNVRFAASSGSGGYFAYWTATTYAWNPVAAFGVRLDSGNIYAFMKGNFDAGYVWPVRGGTLGPNPLPTDTPTPTPTTPPTPTPSPTPTPLPKPVIQQVAPAQVNANIAGSLQIDGARFQPGAVVRLGADHVLSTTFGSSNQLFAHAPGLPAGVYDLTVTNPDGYAGALAGAYRVIGPAATDLYGFHYELTSARLHEVAGTGSWLIFVVHRLAGDATLTNVAVDFYLGSPDRNGQKIGRGAIASLAPNGFSGTQVAWTPDQAGSFEIYAVIDPDNQVAESNETNNTYRSWVTVDALAQVDTTPPTVNSVSVHPGQYTAQVPVGVSVSDPAPSSGLGWLYFLTWEFVPSINDWLVMEESGWLPYASSTVLSIFNWPGPRFLEVYAADQAKNVSEPAGWGYFNYIPPDDFLLTGESRWYLFALLAGERLQADLRINWPDADLYLWGEDGTRHAVSANDGTAAERIDFVAGADGWYWLEVYAYADYPSFFLSPVITTSKEGASPPGSIAPAAHTPRTTPGIDLAQAPVAPSRVYRLPDIETRAFLPLVVR
ncbi:MAG: DUF1566 domain-containing protein [Caldilineaceae bacterium]|nr:DUF1566 domain-containing protein [Caldilineaceae bacterium]